MNITKNNHHRNIVEVLEERKLKEKIRMGSLMKIIRMCSPNAVIFLFKFTLLLEPVYS